MIAKKVAPHFYVPRLRIEENSAKNRRIATAGETPTNSKGTQSSGIPKTGDRRFFEAATVWIRATNQPHILGKITADSLRKSWKR